MWLRCMCGVSENARIKNEFYESKPTGFSNKRDKRMLFEMVYAHNRRLKTAPEQSVKISRN